jgi:biotin carboxyl carrier protein
VGNGSPILSPRSKVLKLQIVIDGKAYEVEYDTDDQAISASGEVVEHAQSLVLPTPHNQDQMSSEIDETKVLRNPVAGIVASIRVELGQVVQAGDVLLVVEAMKMENSLAASTSAKVASLEISVGDTVKIGQVLIRFE